jgi:hypothetical protein
VLGGFVVELDFDFAHGSFHQDKSCFFFGMHHVSLAGKEQYGNEKKQFFHV